MRRGDILRVFFLYLANRANKMGNLSLLADPQISDTGYVYSKFGLFWSQVIKRPMVPVSYVRAMQIEELQNLIDRNEFTACLSANTSPVYHREVWQTITIRRSQLLPEPLRYGDPYQYGTSNKLYGDLLPGRWRVNIPDRLVQGTAISDAIVLPKVCWLRDSDFVIDKEGLLFFFNPFEIGLMEKTRVGDEDQITLFLYGSDWDWSLTQRCYGHVVDYFDPASPQYTQGVRALLRSHAEGNTGLRVRELLSAATGSPVVQSETETVEAVRAVRGKRYVITDLAAYESSDLHQAAVAVGDRVARGDFLFESVQYSEFDGGSLPDWLPELSLSLVCSIPGISPVNSLQSTEVVSVGGETQIRWPMSINADSDDLFWERVHAWRSESDKTFTRLLAEGSDPNIAADLPVPTELLPSEINPLHFFVKTFGQGLSVAKISSPDPNLRLLGKIRDILPPGYLHLNVLN